MLRNYVISAWRNLKKQKLFSLLNLFGLAVGMTAFLVFAYSAISKLHADRFHQDANRIYLLVRNSINQSNEESQSTFFNSEIKNALALDFPEFESIIRVYTGNAQTMRYNDHYFSEPGGLFVDPEFFRFFSFELKYGDSETALADPYSIVISNQIAEKYFGDQNPIGKVISLNNQDNLTVTAVMKDLPNTSSLRFQYLLHFDILRQIYPNFNTYDDNHCTIFIKTKSPEQVSVLKNCFPGFIEKHYPDNDQRPDKIILFPFLKFRLGGNRIDSILLTSHPVMVMVSFLIGIILLLVVSFNFVNMALARNIHRRKEIAVRKTLGANRLQVMMQFLSESLMLSFLALFLAILIYELVQPFLNNYMASINPVSSARISRSIRDIPQMLYYLIGLAVLTGLFSGIYPAFVLSKFQPMQIFRTQPSKPKKKRRIGMLIVFQYILSLLFIVFARISDIQFTKFLSADYGYDRRNVAVIATNTITQVESERIQQELHQNPDVISVSQSVDIPGMWTNETTVSLTDNPQTEYTLEAFGIDYDFIELLNMQIIAGRSFNRICQDENHFIINESAVSKLQLDQPIGTLIILDGKEGIIIGVVKDFLFGDIGFSIPPALLYIEPEKTNYLIFKYHDSGQFNLIQTRIQEKWNVLFPEIPFSCFTLQEHWYKFFGAMVKISTLFGIIGWLAILFSVLGLLGITIYLIEQRKKEIGIRKILGATRTGIILKITSEMIRAIVIANLITIPLIWFAWHKILQTGLLFFEAIPLSVYIFGIGISVGTATLTVLSQVYKVTRVNPVIILKYE